MSRIRVIIDDDPKLGVLQRLRDVTDLSFADIKNRAKLKIPIVECALFLNDHQDRAEQLRSLLAILEGSGLRFRVYESVPTEQPGVCGSQAESQISADTLKQILGEHDREVWRQGG